MLHAVASYLMTLDNQMTLALIQELLDTTVANKK
tara:strand:- start:184 stop:285 length:102 start_codon:yes stop_codon:yes gene_type:complete